ncbi:MAG: nucleotidyltransferase [Candidatus Omnitrophica bacterium]|nr:nucleotidyltransferase [Candidatus Omnitrophota bacterium]
MMLSNIILRALKNIVSFLEKNNIDYCLFGGLAMQLYKRIRATRDIDLMIAVEQNKIADLVNQIQQEEGFSFDKKKGVIKLKGLELLRVIYTDRDTGFEIFIDLVTATTEFPKQILKRKRKDDFLGIAVNVVSLEDLILLKAIADRPIDFVDAAFLCKENKEIINKNYLKIWAKKLGVLDRVKEILKADA